MAASSLTPHLVLFYTTATPTRPTYRRGILDCLCYPNGHVLQYSYRVRQIDPNLLSELPRGSHGAIIFVDEASKGQFVYYPLRRVRILDGLPADQAVRLGPRERVSLFLELADFIGYAPAHNPMQWNDRITPFDDIRRIQDGKPDYFIIKAIDIFTRASVAHLSAWEDVVSNVAKSHDLADAVFLNLENPQGFESGISLALKQGSHVPHYSVSPGEVYRLNMAVYEAKGRETRLKLTSSSDDLVQVNQPFQSVVSGLSQKSARISCRRTTESKFIALGIEVMEDSSATDSKNVVNSPNPTLLIKIGFSTSTLLCFLFLVALGAFFVSWDPDFVKEISSTEKFKLWGLAAKAAGAALLALAAWIGFRKLPSANS